MKSKIVLSIFLIILLGITINLVFAEEGLGSHAPSVLVPELDDSISIEDQQQINQELIKENLLKVSLVILFIISLIISTFITISMVNKNPLILNLIIHSIVLLGSAIISVINSFDTIRCLFSQYCSTTSLGLFYFVTFPSLFLSLFIVWNLGWKKEYENKYCVNMSSGVIILSLLFWIFAFISEMIIQPGGDYSLFPAYFAILLLIVPIGLSLYFIFGIIGLFIDKSHKNS
ncbi:hypothetical protein KAT36_03855 [Candidatus Pacearchaeota archaeon]|nr:hypothetical protein [Candidatus Pacearchaeota archaeon]